MKREKTTNAIKILQNRYIKNDVDREASLEAERINAQIARMIYEARKSAGMSQARIAALIETTQSVISRLENADYEGHSISMLQRIAKVLDCQISISLVKKDSRYVDKHDVANQESIMDRLEEISQKVDSIGISVEKPNIIVVTGVSSETRVPSLTPTFVGGQARSEYTRSTN